MDNYPGTQPAPAISEGIKGWNWGAFLMNWMWAIDNRVWIGLFALVPYAGIIMAIVLGIKGNEWAWKNKKWDSVEHFHKVQKRWTYWGISMTVLAILLGLVAAIVLPTLFVGLTQMPE